MDSDEGITATSISESAHLFHAVVVSAVVVCAVVSSVVAAVAVGLVVNAIFAWAALITSVVTAVLFLVHAHFGGLRQRLMLFSCCGSCCFSRTSSWLDVFPSCSYFTSGASDATA